HERVRAGDAARRPAPGHAGRRLRAPPRRRDGRDLARGGALPARAAPPRVAARARRAPASLLALRARDVRDRRGGGVSQGPERRSGAVGLVPGGPASPAEFGAGHPAQWSRSRVRTLVIASGRGGVGKSNLAANLAVAVAGRGARVLLVDGDLSQPCL